MWEKIKRRKIALLILWGLIDFIIVTVIAKSNNIPTTNNYMAVIGIFATSAPIFWGLILYSEKIKDKKYKLSIVIKALIAFFTLCFVLSSITVLFKQ